MDNIFNKVDVRDLRPIREIVLEELRQAIFKGKIKPGDRLVETTIADGMGVSRTPVREALRQIELEGLAENMPRKGTVVKGITKEEALDIYDVRAVMEGLATKLCCLNISRKDILELKNVIKEMEISLNSKDVDNFILLHNKWNDIILTSSNNKYLIRSINQINEYLSMLRSISLYTDESRRVALKEHKEILDAIEAGDENLSEALVKKHVENAKNRFLNY